MLSKPTILMRANVSYERDEQTVAERFFNVVGLRTLVPPGSLVVGRYANLPFHNELEQDVHNLGSRLINSTQQHRYVADFDYYEDLRDVTFPTWFDAQSIPSSVRSSSAFVVKGRTNSIKQAWSQLMFAKDFANANQVAAALRADGLIGPQGVVYRQYVPLETFETSVVSGMPFSNEWRIFYYQGQRLAHGFYWSGIDDWTAVERATPNFLTEGLPFADEVAQRLVDKIPFVVVDIARTQEGRWMVVELNDGCQAGLNDSVPADTLYSNLQRALR